MLGEFNHGAKEIFLLRNRLIQYLHQKHGYDLLLMESGVGEMIKMNYSKAKMTPKQIAFSGLMGPWCTEEFEELLTYTKGTNNLYVGGYDVQKTGSSFKEILIEVLNKIDAGIAKNATNIEEMNHDFVKSMKKNKKDPHMSETYENLVEGYLDIEQVLDENYQTLIEEGVEEIQLNLIFQTLKNRIGYLDYYYQFKNDNDWSKRFAARDSFMAINTVFFVEELFPSGKIIICGHNYHISKYNEKQLTMGEKLVEKYDQELLSIAIFGGNGNYASNSRKTKTLEVPIKNNDLRKIMQNSENEISFLPFSAAKKNGGEWIDQDVTITDSFINLSKGKTLNLNQTFDALIFIKNISPPVFLKWE